MFITPASLACGVSVQVSRVYRPQNYLGWALVIAGFGILSILDVDSSKAQYICCQIVVGVGLGIVWISTQFPILAPLPFSNNALALAFFTFVRSLSQVSLAVFSKIDNPRPTVAHNRSPTMLDVRRSHRWHNSTKLPQPQTTRLLHPHTPRRRILCLLRHPFHRYSSRTNTYRGPRSVCGKYQATVGGDDWDIGLRFD